MKKITLFICFLITLIVNSQETNYLNNLNLIDSLLKSKAYDKVIHLGNDLLKNKISNDSIIAKTNLSIGQAFFEKADLETSEYHLKKAYTYKHKNRLLIGILKSLAKLYERQAHYDLALTYLNEELEISKFLFSENSNETAEKHARIAGIHIHKSDYRLAKTYMEKGLKIIDSISGDKKIKVTLLIDLAICTNYEGDYNLSIKYGNEAIKLQQEIYGESNINSVILYNNLAENYNLIGDIEKAIEYQKKALDLAITFVNNKNPILGTIYFNLGVYNQTNNKIDDAFINYKKALEVYKKTYGLEHPYIGVIQNALGSYYDKKENYKLALEFYTKSINLWVKSLGENHVFVANGYSARGDFYKERKKFDLAIKDLIKSLEIKKNLFDEFNDKVAIANLELANCYLLNEDYKSTEKYLDLARSFFPKEAIEAKNFDAVNNKIVLTNYFSIRSTYLSLMKKDNTSYLDSLSINYDYALKLQDNIQKSYLSNNAKEFQLKDAFSLYEDYINFLYEQNNNLELAFELSEKTKSRRLMERFNQINTINENILPKKVSNQEKLLNKDISYYQEQIYLEKRKTESNEQLIKQNEDKLFELKRDREKLHNIFKTKYPKYYQLKYNHKVISLSSIQEHLNDNQAIIEYFVGETNIFSFIITHTDFKVHRIKNNFQLNELTKQLRAGICDYWSTSTTNTKNIKTYNAQYREAAHTLYNKLIAPFNSHIPEELIIIPDSKLHLIPFDALLTDKTDTNSYLIKKYQISYNYSTTNYLEIQKHDKKHSENNLLAIAPSFKSDKYTYTNSSGKRNLGVLKHNVEEAETITNLFNGTLLKNTEATKSNFLEKAKSYKLLHLSTHAKSNDTEGEFSFIAFQNKTNTDFSNENLLFVSELYNLDLNADMVVLSACETGIGEIKKGEGVIGLAHGFSYAGAKSTITSLWSVNDAQTSKLMELFYTNIKQGMRKDKALREAKLTYISNENLVTPYFWAGFIPIGNMQAIETPFNYNFLLIIGFIVILLLVFILLRKTQKKQTK